VGHDTRIAPYADRAFDLDDGCLTERAAPANTFLHQTLKPASADDCPVRLETGLASKEVREGDSVRLTVKLKNVSGKGQGMAVAILGLPAGLIVPPDLKRLFACACLRAASATGYSAGLTVADVMERVADQAAPPGEVFSAWEADPTFREIAAGRSLAAGDPVDVALRRAGCAALASYLAAVRGGGQDAPAADENATAASDATRLAQADLLRDLFGPLPFRLVPIDPAWLTWGGGAVVRLARATYDGRALPAGTLDTARLAVLADALLDAGCTDAALLGHLRSAGAHYRGCFAVDLLLGLA
jgi:hypothetical protein